MAYPTEPVLDYSYTGFQQAQGDDSFPGTQLDNDLAILDQSITEIIAFLQVAHAADGTLANGSVTFDSLDTALKAILQDAEAVEDLNELVATATAAAVAAEASETACALSEANVAALYDQFDDRYLGSKNADPALDNDGNTLLTGAMYWNNVSNALKVYTGVAWTAYLGAVGILELSEDLTPQLGGNLDLNGHVITGMVIGVDVQAYDVDTTKNDVANTFTAKQTFSDFAKFQRLLEKVTITANKPAVGDNHFDVKTQSIQYYTVNNANNWALNLRGDSSTTLNSLMAAGEALTVVLIVTNGTTAYYQTALKIDTVAVTPQWLGAAAPTAGTPSKRDTYTFTVIKTADAAWIVQATFARGF